jgi:hypothetical protein
MYPTHFISETISKDICAQLAREVVSLVPQVVDYTCAICESQPSRFTRFKPRFIVANTTPR